MIIYYHYSITIVAQIHIHNVWFDKEMVKIVERKKLKLAVTIAMFNSKLLHSAVRVSTSVLFFIIVNVFVPLLIT